MWFYFLEVVIRYVQYSGNVYLNLSRYKHFFVLLRVNKSEVKKFLFIYFEKIFLFICTKCLLVRCYSFHFDAQFFIHMTSYVVSVWNNASQWNMIAIFCIPLSLHLAATFVHILLKHIIYALRVVCLCICRLLYAWQITYLVQHLYIDERECGVVG